MRAAAAAADVRSQVQDSAVLRDLLPNASHEPEDPYGAAWERKRAFMLERLARLQRESAPDPKAVAEARRGIDAFLAAPRPGGLGTPDLVPAKPRRAPTRSPKGLRERHCAVASCDGSGWIIDDADEARECECRRLTRVRRKQTRLRRLAGSMGLSPSLERPPLDALAPEQRLWLEQSRAGMANLCENGGTLWLEGDPALTEPCAAFLAAGAVDAGLEASRWRVAVLLHRLRGLGGTAGRAAAQAWIYDELAHVDLLVLDQLDDLVESRNESLLLPGRAARGEQQRSLRPGYRELDTADIADLVRQRCYEGMPLIVSSKRSPEYLHEALSRIGRVDLLLGLIRVVEVPSRAVKARAAQELIPMLEAGAGIELRRISVGRRAEAA